MSEQHRGAADVGPLTKPVDVRVGTLDHAVRAIESVVQSICPGLGRVMGDAQRVIAGEKQSTQAAGHFFNGTIVHAIGHAGWYRIQGGNRLGFVYGCHLSQSGTTPLGVRETHTFPPNAEVLCYLPANHTYVFILGAIPPDLQDGRNSNPDSVVAGGQSGLRREALHKFPIQSHFREGGVRDFSCQRPVDVTSFEWGQMSSTGLGITIDDYLVQLRVNEACGLFMTYFDSWCKLAGVQLDIQSAVHEERARDDEGEARYMRGVATYPWEAQGLYRPGEDTTHTFTDEEVQFTKARSKLDLGEGDEDLQPIYRYMEWGGYEGQGHHRLVCKPAKDSGKRHFGDADDADEGLFAETIGLDGAYSLRSAKSVYLGRRTNIIVPKEIKLPEDGHGDDSAGDTTYKFSGEFGDGEEHRLQEIEVTGEHKHMRRVAAVDDLVAFNVNWKSLHPFHYHRKDYRTRQEGDGAGKFSRVQDVVSLGDLASSTFTQDPSPVRLQIDHRYGSVEFYQRESFLYFTDDGSVILTAGQGESLVLGGGNARLEAPGDVQICPGRVSVTLAEQIVLRAKRSVDISASEHDVSIKAEQNLRMLGGNSGRGGVLIESRGIGRSQTYEGRIGEEIDGRGVVLKAANGLLGLYGKEIYLRTGGSELGDGEIVIDASRGRKNVNFKGKEFNFFCPNTVNFYYGPVEESSSVTKAYAFAKKYCLMDVPLFLGGKLIGYQGTNGRPGVIVDGPVLATKAIATAGRMADKKGGMIGKVPPNLAGAIAAATAAAADVANVTRQQGEKKHEYGYVMRLYQPNQPGATSLIKTLQFSFRDPASENQYGVTQFKWTESRWQQMVRFGLATGGTPWTERKVMYNGESTYPYPGRKKLTTEAVFLQLEELTMFDPATGCSRDRPGPYEEPKLAAWSAGVMNSMYKLIR